MSKEISKLHQEQVVDLLSEHLHPAVAEKEMAELIGRHDDRDHERILLYMPAWIDTIVSRMNAKDLKGALRVRYLTTCLRNFSVKTERVFVEVDAAKSASRIQQLLKENDDLRKEVSSLKAVKYVDETTSKSDPGELPF
jgi:hypothetical protein